MIVTVLVGARYGQREKVFDAVIDKVEVKRARGSLAARDRARQPGDPARRRVHAWLSQLYNREVTDDDTVTVIRFSQILGTMF